MIRFQAVAAAFLLLASGATFSQRLPEGTVRMIVPFPSGGPTDVLTRILSERLPPRIDRTVIVENRTGSAGNIAGEVVAKAKPDGLTLLAAIDSIFTINPFLYETLAFDTERDFKAVTLLGTWTLVLAAHPRVPVKNLKELIAYAKDRPLNFASGGNGSPGHLGFEYLRHLTGLKGVHIPYRGGAPAATALLAGEVDAAFISTSVLVPLVRAGKTTALAVSDLKRYHALPEVPTVAESGFPDFQMVFSYLLVAPAATPAGIIALLNREVRAVLEPDEVKQRLAGAGIAVLVSTPEEAQAWLKTERNRWEKVIRATGMSAK